MNMERYGKCECGNKSNSAKAELLTLTEGQQGLNSGLMELFCTELGNLVKIHCKKFSKNYFRNSRKKNETPGSGKEKPPRRCKEEMLTHTWRTASSKRTRSITAFTSL